MPSVRSIVLASSVVFAIAMVVRVPSCYESFWLDELHSAWCIWDTVGEVLPRADIGHQQPFYFLGLWCWKQIVGDSEVALRMSSVLAVAASCVVLTVGAARWTGSVAGGLAAGLVLATENHSIFFGTELRPYALVILFSSVALVCFLHLAAEDSRHRRQRWWIAFVVAILMATACQPTAIGVLVFLLLVLCLVWLVRDRSSLVRITLVDGFLAVTVAAIGFTIWTTTLGDTWQQRSNWSSFATATHAGQIWEAWEWTWLLLLPLGLVVIATVTATTRRRWTGMQRIAVTTIALAAIAVLATALYWAVSRLQWAPVWHRRYFIAVLPIFASLSGSSVAMLQQSWGPSRKSLAAGLLMAVGLATVPLFFQGTLMRLKNYPVALATRGEDWRSAIQWVRENAEANDTIYLDAGLIEARAWLGGQFGVVRNEKKNTVTIRSLPVVQPTAEQLKYLVFPVRGPYELNRDVVPLIRHSGLPGIEIVPGGKAVNRSFTIVRRSADRVKLFRGEQSVNFGGVTVIFRPSDLDQRF